MANVTAVIKQDGATERSVELPDGTVWPVYIGSSPDCAIVLDSPAIAPRQARLDGLSNHIFLTAVEAGPISAHDRPVVPGKEVRVDSTPFQIGPFQVRIDY